MFCRSAIPCRSGYQCRCYSCSNYAIQLEKCNKDVQVSKQWNNAFISVQQSRIGVVKYTNRNDIVIQPMETQTITGFVRKARNVEAAITKNTEGASTKLGVCPRIVSLEEVGNYQRVPVRIFNMSAKVLTITPNITDKQKEQLSWFFSNWKGIFSTGITDLGNCDLVQHEIKLKDSELFKDPYRRIPPALFEEVREHLQEMIEAGSIRPSHSAYSCNVELVRKNDGSLRFCVAFANSIIKRKRMRTHSTCGRHASSTCRCQVFL